MAIDLSTIKSLTIPEGSVVKITDSNGVVLYNQSAYRELEYIKFSGDEYIQEDFNLSAKNRRYYLEYTCDEFLQNTSLLAQWDNTQNANKRRLYIVRCSNASGEAAWYIGSKYATYNMSLNTKYKSTCVYTNASSNTLTYELKDSSDTVLTSGTLVETTTSLDTIDSAAALGTTKLRDNSGVISYGGYWVGKLYKFQKYIDSSNTLQNDQVPCQRKSDGVCGLYDLTNDIFYPMTGTIITDAAAGPTTTENPSWSPARIETYTSSGISMPITGAIPTSRVDIGQLSATPQSVTVKCRMHHGAVGESSYNDRTGTMSIYNVPYASGDGSTNRIYFNSSLSSDTYTMTATQITLSKSGIIAQVQCGSKITSGIDMVYSTLSLQYDSSTKQFYLTATKGNTAVKTAEMYIDRVEIVAYY